MDDSSLLNNQYFFEMLKLISNMESEIRNLRQKHIRKNIYINTLLTDKYTAHTKVGKPYGSTIDKFGQLMWVNHTTDIILEKDMEIAELKSEIEKLKDN